MGLDLLVGGEVLTPELRQLYLKDMTTPVMSLTFVLILNKLISEYIRIKRQKYNTNIFVTLSKVLIQITECTECRFPDVSFDREKAGNVMCSV